MQTLRSDELLTLWQHAGVNFSEESLAHLNRVEAFRLFRCWKCGFQFFDPELAAGSRFYADLQAEGPEYYAPARPENERNARFAQEHGFHKILDIGCGTGFALDAARTRRLETYGIEFNEAAAAEARSRGHTVFSIAIENLDPSLHGEFDLISLNQVLEHLPDPVGLLRNCLSFLSPRGVIAIAVPSAEGVLRLNPWLPSNWPPHHLSRWRRQDFDTLGKACGLKTIRTGGNQLLGSELEQNLVTNREHCLVLGKNYRGLGPSSIKLLAFLYRKTGMKFLFRSSGHSIFCFLQRKP